MLGDTSSRYMLFLPGCGIFLILSLFLLLLLLFYLLLSGPPLASPLSSLLLVFLFRSRRR